MIDNKVIVVHYMIQITELHSINQLHGMLLLLHQASNVVINTNIDSSITALKSIISNENHHYYLIIEEETIIGLGCLLIRQTLCYNCKSVGYIEDIIIDRSRRGNGFGKVLINHIVKEAKKHNCYKVVLQSHPQLTPYYKSCGMKHTHETMSINL